MKELKYLKLFEAFESEKLSKTLGYIDAKGRKELLTRLKKFCEQIDFPFSKLNDSYFQYLPYQKALKLQYADKKTPCKATSKSEFGSHGIEGETCQKGKIRRMWGSRQRVVDCPNCSGTGIQPEQQEIKVLKYWFNKSGEYITTSCLDNVHKPKVRDKSFSKELRDYNIVGERIQRYQSFSQLEKGNIVLAKLSAGVDEHICYVWKSGRQTYLIQDRQDGDHPSGRDWTKYGRYSWNITNDDFIWMQQLEPKKDIEQDEQEVDPFSYNKLVSYNYRSIGVDRYTSNKEVEKIISRADFALVFNLDLLKSSEFKSGSEIKDERAELKAGSRLTVKDEDIKKANINRYMQEIAKRSDIVSDISNLPKVVKRFIGGENVLFLMIYNSRFLSNLDKIAELYTEALKEGDSDYYKNKLSNYISDRYKSISNINMTIANNSKYIKDVLKRSDEFQDSLKILEGLEELSKRIYQKISVMPIECVEDLDIVRAKLDSLRQIFRISRYNFDKLDYFIDSLTTSTNPENALRYLTNHYYIRDYKTEIIQGIEQANKVLDRY